MAAVASRHAVKHVAHQHWRAAIRSATGAQKLADTGHTAGL